MALDKTVGVSEPVSTPMKLERYLPPPCPESPHWHALTYLECFIKALDCCSIKLWNLLPEGREALHKKHNLGAGEWNVSLLLFSCSIHMCAGGTTTTWWESSRQWNAGLFGGNELDCQNSSPGVTEPEMPGWASRGLWCSPAADGTTCPRGNRAQAKPGSCQPVSPRTEGKALHHQLLAGNVTWTSH